jgi:tetratricopeptide (TPR) repeat protein
MGRSRTGIKISLLAFFILAGIVVASAQTADEKFSLLIHGFELDTLESLSEKTIEVAPLLEESFSRYDEITILNRQDFSGLAIERLQSDVDSANIEGIDAIVYGDYVVVNEYIKIQSIIYTTQDGLFHRVNYSRGTLSGLKVLMEEVRDNIYETLVDVVPALQQSVKKIAFVSDYETVSGQYDDIGMMKKKSQELTREIMQEIDYIGPSNTEVIPMKLVQQYLDNPSPDALNELDADMFLRLTYVFSGVEVVALRADFDILEKARGRIMKREFVLPELRWDYYTNFDFQEFVSNEMLAFFNRIVSQTGQWDYIAFPNKSSVKASNKDVLINRAQNFAIKSDFYLSSYHYYEAMEMFPEEVDATEIKLQIGFNKVYTDRFEEAKEEFDYVLSVDPDNSYAYLGKSLVNYYQGNVDQAVEYLEMAREKGVENAFLVEVLKGYYFYDLGNFQEALTAFRHSLEIEQTTVKIRIINNLSVDYIKIHIGLCYVGLGQFGKAIDYYKEVKRDYPYNKEIDYYLGNAYYKKGIDEYFIQNYAEAISDFNASRKYFTNKTVNDYLRTALIYEKRFNEAREFISEEIDAGNYDTLFIWPDHGMDIRRMMIDEYQPGSGYDETVGTEAIHCFGLHLQYFPEDPMTHYYIGEIYTFLGEFEKGLQSMEEAYRIDDINFDIQLGLMQSYLLTGNYEQCEKLERSLSKLYRKLTVPSRFTALMDYLYISASMTQEKKAKKATKQLNKLLSDKVVIDSWYYEPYLQWLDSCDCSEETREYLSDLTQKMKERNLN